MRRQIDKYWLMQTVAVLEMSPYNTAVLAVSKYYTLVRFSKCEFKCNWHAVIVLSVIFRLVCTCFSSIMPTTACTVLF